jgi:hypothetical protein
MRRFTLLAFILVQWALLGVVESVPAKALELPPVGIVWHVPIGCDPTGFFFEAVTYAVEFEKRGIPFCLNSGKCSDHSSVLLDASDMAAVKRVQDACDKPLRAQNIVTVHHQRLCDSKDSGLVPLYRNDNSSLIVVRTMTETGFPPQGEVECLLKRRVDQVWLPSQWHVNLFHHAGAPRSKLAAVPEATPLHSFFPSPPHHHPEPGLLDLFGANSTTLESAEMAIDDDNSSNPFFSEQRKAAERFEQSHGHRAFVFVSVFKVSTGR